MVLWPRPQPRLASSHPRRPETTITKAPERESWRTTTRFRFRSSEPDSSVACRLDRRALNPCESSRRYRELAPGRHTFAVETADAAGNRDPSPALARFRVLKRTPAGRQGRSPGDGPSRSRPR